MNTLRTALDDIPDLAQWVPRWNALFQINRAEQRTARLVRPAHHHPRRCRAKGESCSQTTVEAGPGQQPVSGWFPAISLFVFGVGFVERDGLVATIGLICGGASVLLTAAILTSLAAGAEAMID